jgi:hypothetical protein
MCNLSHHPVISSLLDPYIVSAPTSPTPSPYVTPQRERPVEHPYGTTGKIVVLYILTFIFSDRNMGDTRFWT